MLNRRDRAAVHLGVSRFRRAVVVTFAVALLAASGCGGYDKSSSGKSGGKQDSGKKKSGY